MLKGFIITLVIAAVASAMIEGFLPDTGMKKYIKYLISLIILVVLISPLPEIFNKLAQSPESADMFSYDSVQVYTKANAIVAMRIKRSLCEKFELDTDNTEVKYENGGIYVLTHKRFGLFESDISLYIKNNFGVDAEVSFFE